MLSKICKKKIILNNNKYNNKIIHSKKGIIYNNYLSSLSPLYSDKYIVLSVYLILLLLLSIINIFFISLFK